MTFLFVVAAALAVTSCGSKSTTTEGTDAVKVDSTSTPVDSVATADTTAAK